MDRELAATLKDLGLSATEAGAYVALLQHAGAGPITAYRLAQVLGRDPANTTKVMGMMVKRGAVTASGKRPRRYAPVAPRRFIGRLVADLQARQDLAITRLEEIDQAPVDAGPQALDSRAEAEATARQLLDEASHVVLVGADPDWLASLGDTLEHLRRERGVAVVTRAASGPAGAPGPWLQLVCDGAACLSAVAAADGDALVYGQWSRNPGEAFLVQRALAALGADAGADAGADPETDAENDAETDAETDPAVDEPLTFVHRRRRDD
jgi:hypothetical protein